MEVSPFRMSIFRQCRRRYRFQYVDRLWPRYRKPRPYLTMGDHVHGALNAFFSPLVPPESRTISNLEDLLRTRWRKNRAGFKDLADERAWGERALRQLRLFFDTQDVLALPWLSEAVHKTAIGHDIVAMGRIDRVDRNADGAVIIDYKTGKQRNNADQLQLLTYAVIVTRKFGVPVLSASYLYLATGEMATVKPGEEDLRATVEHLNIAAEEMRCAREFPPSPGPLCRYCDFAELCGDVVEPEADEPDEEMWNRDPPEFDE